jgi:oligosaccharide reducing-end xylanase
MKILIITLILSVAGVIFVLTIGSLSSGADPDEDNTAQGSYYTGEYSNIFRELLDVSEAEVQKKIDNAWNQLFYGDNERERIYYPVGQDMAYIEDILHKDVRSEGISYGLMIAVQLNKKEEFDRLWKWAKKYMQYNKGQRKHYFAWQLDTDGKIMGKSTASDGDEWIVMSLFFASARWGNGEGIFNYEAEAQLILDAMLGKAEPSDNDTVITNMFSKEEKLVVFVPSGKAAGFTDPSYHLPHFYELWARWDDNNNTIWCEAASASRKFLKKAAHPETGLYPDHAYFDGTPADLWNRGHDNFSFDAFRVAMNIGVDYQWFARDKWAVAECNRLLDFFYGQGIGRYVNRYTLDGKPLSDQHSPGLTAMNAVASLAATTGNRVDFVRELWEMPTPDGQGRYYDGMLYMFALLQLSGNFRVYELTGSPVTACE